MANQGLSRFRIGPQIKVLEEPLKSISEFESWKYSVLYTLRLDADVKPHLKDENAEFGKKTPKRPTRLFVDSIDNDGKVTSSAEDKCAVVDFMLDTIAQFCPKIPHNDLCLDCASLSDVWQVIRLHSNIQTSGALLNDVWNMTRQPNETSQALYSRLKQAYDDNLIRAGTLVYKDKTLNNDETLSPTLHCTIILHWLQILHPKLRDLVTQRFCTELRNVSYAALWPEISRNVDMYIKELEGDRENQLCRVSDGSRFGNGSRFGDGNRFSSNSRPPQRARGSYSRFPSSATRSSTNKHCEYCKLTGRRFYFNHTMEDCLFFKKEKSAGVSRSVEGEEYDHYQEFYDEYPNDVNQMSADHVINQVAMDTSPVLTLYKDNIPYDVTLDTGGTCSITDVDTANELGCDIRPTLQGARLGDGKTRLNIVGETEIDFNRHGQVYRMNALVADVAEPTILGGIPFLKANDIGIRPARNEVNLNKSDEVIKYIPGSSRSLKNKIRRVHNFTIRSPRSTVVLPGEEVSYEVPDFLHLGTTVAVEPRLDNHHNAIKSFTWPSPQVVDVVDGVVTLKNTTGCPVLVKKNAHICNILPAMSPEDTIGVKCPSTPQSPSPKKLADYSAVVKVNPDKIVSDDVASKFSALLKLYDEVFNPTIAKYNGKSGPCFVEVNMGHQPPPQHKGRVPFYGRDNLVELQAKIDELVYKGVFKRPQEIGVTVEVVNPSFLVKKRSSDDKRLVTDFGQIASYCRPTPTVLPDVESTLRQVAEMDVIIVCDLKESYFQFELNRRSMKYCGIASPFKGVFVYTRGCMGLPGTEVALEELTCLLFGHLVLQGKLAKLADDLIVGAKDVDQLLINFEEVLQILQENDLRLNAKKTVVLPKSLEILGWIWSGGFLKASPHRLSALNECDPPDTVKGLKSYIGAYRFISRVIKNYASLLQPLEAMVTGNVAPNTKIQWIPSQLQAFRAAQSALKNSKDVVMPKPDDMLQIVTDAAMLPSAIGAVLYAIRGGKTLLAGYFNAKLPVFQQKWIPCEQEGVAIGVALNHFGPYLIRSRHRPCVLTDSKACVQAVDKLNRGEYSASARLGTFLSSVSRFQADVKHIQGSSNLVSDFLSRNPLPCTEERCQICSFIRESMVSVVAAVSVDDVLSGKVLLPFASPRSAWREIQEECPDLRNVSKYIRNGTTPGKKGRNLRQVKRYMTAKAVLTDEGLLVVRQIEPYSSTVERIIVPQQVLHGILTVLHIKLNHPSAMQLTKVFNRIFFALNLDAAVTMTTKTCHQCQSLKEVPAALKEQSSDPPPERIAQHFAADVIKRNSQLILVLRECTSSLTQAELVTSEKAADISDALIRLCNLFRPSTLMPIKIRLDPHPSNKSLYLQIQRNGEFAKYNIMIDIGRELNKNHNPVAEKAVRELIGEILKLVPEGGAVSSTILSQAVAALNSRIRSPGLSAYEVFTQRDQTSGRQLSIDDQELIESQSRRRMKNHEYSERSKSKLPPHTPADVDVGSIVYLYDDKSKLAARPRYIVVSVDGIWCKLKRFAEKRLGTTTYSAKLTEVYVVPDGFSDVSLPPYPDEEEQVVVHEVQDGTMPESEDPVEEPDEEELGQPVDPCSSCKEPVAEEDTALTCDTCLNWCHTGCGGVSQEVYQHILDHAEDVRWMCPSCINVASDPTTKPHVAVRPAPPETA